MAPTPQPLIKSNVIPAIEGETNTLLKCMIIVTATELCGSFLTAKTGPRSTKENFLAFWNSKYMPKKYHKVSNLLYEILRNGVSHTFIAKGGVIPSRDKSGSHYHLKCLQGGVYIDANQLGEDVINGLKQYLEDKKVDPKLNKKYLYILEKLQIDGILEYKRFLIENDLQPLNYTINGDISPDL